MAWFLDDKSNAYADAVLDLLATAEALVPAIWALEVTNVLLVAERRKRLTEAESFRIVKLLRDLPITMDHNTPDRITDQILPVARRLGLSAYDATYLELAMREGAALATIDEGLKKAARKIGVRIVSAGG